MNPESSKNARYMLFATGIAAGTIIAMVDNLVLSGVITPFIIAAMLLAAAGTSGIIWRWQGWIVAVGIWICDPLVHLSKHLLGLPDTLSPNTYMSILLLTLFMFVISFFGLSFGVLVRKITKV